MRVQEKKWKFGIAAMLCLLLGIFCMGNALPANAQELLGSTLPANAQELLESALPESAQKNSLQKGGMTYAVSGGTLTVQGSGELADVASALEETGEGSAEEITAVIVEDGITSIGSKAFTGFENLSSIQLPDSLTSIKEFAFWECQSLKSVTVPDSVRYLGIGVFQECTSLESAVIGSGVTKLPIQLFRSCRSLKSVTFRGQVEEIGEQCFCYCTSLGSFTVPDSVLNVGKNAFLGCQSLTLTMPDALEANGDGSYQQRGGILVEGSRLYSEAGTMLNLVNQEREKQGLPALSMDAELLEEAMERAAELAIDFSHVRPDGTNFSTVSAKVKTENIAAGNSSTQEIYSDWISSAGHRANILDTEVKSIGIGCFAQGETRYWVQLFSDEAAERTGSGLDGKAKVRIRARAGAYPMTLEKDTWILEPRKSAELVVLLKNKGNPLLTAKISPETFWWSSSNEEAVRVENGKITAAGSGKATVTAALKDGGSEKLKASVTVNTKVTKIRLEDKTIRLALGETYRLKPEVRPKDAYDPSLSYESSKPSVVSVNRKGLLRAKKKGTARITIESRDGGARVQVKVIVGDYPSSIRLSGVPRKMAVKDKVRLQAAVLPQGTKYTGVRWSSSDRTIAAVNKNGVVTAKKPGKATITCQARFGATAKKSVTITVVPEAPAYRATAGKRELTLKIKPVKGAVQYTVYLSTKPDRGFKKAEVTKERTCTIDGLRKGKTYYVKVRAAGKAGRRLLAGEFGSVKKVKVK